MVDDKRLGDVTSAAEDILRHINSSPTHVRPWLRGLEAEAERVCVEVNGVRRRAASRFLTWVFQGLEETP